MITAADLSISNLQPLSYWLCVVSLLMLVFPIVVFAFDAGKNKFCPDSQTLSFDKKLLLFTICLTISMWCLQFISEFYDAYLVSLEAINKGAEASQIYVPEIVVNTFNDILKSFGADDNFLSGIHSFKLVLVNILGANDIFVLGYSCYASALSFIAPIISVTIFFEILANFFPKLKLWFLRWCPCKKKYYFSELNERSLALAKSIRKTEKRKVSIIFTDVYANKVQESTTELLAEAKRIGAICLRDDITHIQKRGLGERKYFLIDDNEVINLQTLTNLTNKSNYRRLKKSEVYLFCQDYIYTDVEKQVREALNEKYKLRKKTINKYYNFLQKMLDKHYEIPDKKDLTEKERYKILQAHLNDSYENAIFRNRAVTIIPVRCYRNLITNMLEKTPLYEPIVHLERDAEHPVSLNVTILGIGDIGTEMFLTTYWMGQMLDCKLNINVISRESKEEFWGKIDYINPEIRYTTYEKDELLRIYKNKDEFSDPYCKVNYISCDIQSEDFRKLLDGELKCTIGDEEINPVLDAHYLLVSLGSDHANLSIANILKRRIGKYHIENKEQKDKTIINYIVYNTDLSETLNNNQFVCSHSNKPDIFMQAVGGIENVYCAENIFMTKYKTSSESAAKSYDSKQSKIVRTKFYKKRLKDEYEYWSNLALRLHFKYKVFSMGYFNLDKEFPLSLFEAYTVATVTDKNNETHIVPGKVLFSHEKYCNFTNEACSQYKNDYRKKNANASSRYDKAIENLEKCKKVIHLSTKTFRPFNQTIENLQRYVKNMKEFNSTMKNFMLFIINKSPKPKEQDSGREPTQKENLLQWLEHRRWCAFIRTMGFRQTKDYEEYLDITQSHKQMDIKLHPCLIECDKCGIHGTLYENGNVKSLLFTIDEHPRDDLDVLDMLDLLSLDLYKLKKEKFENVENFKPYDFKQYDYPNNDYLDDIYTKKEQKK